MNREWGILIALGLLAAAVLLAVDDDGDDAEPGPSTGSETPAEVRTATLTPFARSFGKSGTNATFLVIAPHGQQAAEAALNRTDEWAVERLDWAGGNAERGVEAKIAYLEGTHGECLPTANGMLRACRQGDLSLPVAELQQMDGPRLGVDGYNGTRATIYVFDERGLLAATNDAKGNWSRFAGSPTTMDSAVWYIGANATAPEGTQKPPSFAAPLIQKLRPLMEGLPVGGVASTQSNAFVSLYGTLFITARIDALVYAP